MDVLKESPIWVTPVYAIERTDPLMGGEFGINNVQARQLAWRTQYLRALLAMNHQPDGSHLLWEHHVARLAAIAESKLRLSVPTSRIRVEIDKLEIILSSIKQGLDSISGTMGTPLRAIYDALMMSWEYGYTRYAFELFTDNFSLRDAFQDVRVIETIAGDDSIDLETTGTIASGESYLIIDRKTGAQQQVTIKEILTGRRVLLHEIMQFSTNDTAVLSKSSWEYVGNKAEASAGATYMTVMTKLLDDIEQGRLIISHTEDVRFTVEYHSENDSPTDWTEVPCTRTYTDDVSGNYRSIYDVPGGRMAFRITALGDTDVDHIVLMSSTTGVLPSTVRTPKVIAADFKLERFGALYDAKHAGTEIQLAADNYFADAVETVTLPASGDVAPVWNLKDAVLAAHPMNPGESVWWRARYHADDGNVSLWSESAQYGQVAVEDNDA